MQEKINRLLADAVWAPSGENCQPWRFVAQGNTVRVFNIPERDMSLYSWGDRASLVAHGALLENILISASHYGLQGQIQLFPDPLNEQETARVVFTPIAAEEESLYSFLRKRVTNRKPYKKTVCPLEIKEKLLALSEKYQNARLFITENEEEKKSLAQVAGLSDQLVFENFHSHSFFFHHLTWTREEDKKKSIGFFIKTLEVPLPVVGIFKLISHWNILQRLNKIGFARLIGKQNAGIYANCAAMGAITIPTGGKEECVEAGRLFERVWLTLTAAGLSLQPLTGLLFLALRVKNKAAEGLIGPAQQEFILKSYERVEQSFHHPAGSILLLFRLGDGGRPSARSNRLPVDVTFV